MNLQVIYQTTQGEILDEGYFTGYDSKEKLYNEIKEFFKKNKEEWDEPLIFYNDENFNLVSISQEIITGVEILEVK